MPTRNAANASIADRIVGAARRRGMPVPPFDLDLIVGSESPRQNDSMTGEAAVARVSTADDLDAIVAAFEGLVAGRGGRRRSVGAYYTPPSVASSLVRRVATGAANDFVDPAVGAGTFLLRAADLLASLGTQRRHIIERQLFGVDIDERAVELTRTLLWLWTADRRTSPAALREHVRAGDGLGLATPWPLERSRFRAVVGNPPFLDSERLCREQPAVREAARSRFRCARGNYDQAVLFAERALELCAPATARSLVKGGAGGRGGGGGEGGRMGLVLPARILAADYAAPLRALLLSHRPRVITACDDSARFAATNVPVITVVVQVGRADARARVEFQHGTSESTRVRLATLRRIAPEHFAAALRFGDGPELDRLAGASTLGDVATICDGATTAEAYLIRALVREDAGPESTEHRSAGTRRSPPAPHSPPTPTTPRGRTARSSVRPSGPTSLRLVNTGTIDPYRLLWGERPIRYLGWTGLRPTVDHSNLARIAPRRAEQAMREKVVVAGLASRLEAAVAPPGVLCGKSACVVLPRPGVCPHAVAAYLNTPATTELYRAMFGFRGFSAASLAIGARQLERLPCPDQAKLRPGTALSVQGRVKACGFGQAVGASPPETTAGQRRRNGPDRGQSLDRRSGQPNCPT